MAYDGLVVLSSVMEFKSEILGGKLSRIIQPEKDELLIQVRLRGGSRYIKLSANASLPMASFVEKTKNAPKTAPSFSMALRKHIGNGSIKNIYQPDTAVNTEGLERVIIFEIEHLDEMGDMCKRYLSIELMGKHSNIILLKEDMTIIDSIKHISASQSSVREVLPGRAYFIPDSREKKNPLNIKEDEFISLISANPKALFKCIYQGLTGISPLSANEFCYRAGLDPDIPGNLQSAQSLIKLYGIIKESLEKILSGNDHPNIIYKDGKPYDFSAIQLTIYENDSEYIAKKYDSISRLIEDYYSEKDLSSRMNQKSGDLRHIINNLIERNVKKINIQEKLLKGSRDKDKYRYYGEFLTAYGYDLKGGEKSLTCLNYYTNEDITIPLDPDFSALENSQRYFKKYDKLKRTENNAKRLLIENKNEHEHLISIKSALLLAEDEEDLAEIKKEMQDYGYISAKKSYRGKKFTKKSKPYHFLSSDGYHIYVGKNNYQNENLSFNFAEKNDIWFHLKGAPGSHVIVSSNGEKLNDLPDRLFIEAAELAGWYSSERTNKKAEIDYTFVKELKKVPDTAPGFCIYHQNWSIVIENKKPYLEKI